MHIKRSTKKLVLASRFLPLVSRLQSPQCIILRYHSILPTGHPLATTIGEGIVHRTDTFERQMALLSKKYRVISLDDLAIAVCKQDRNVRRAVVVTFDDGYRDNLEFAAPIMEKYGVRGTTYVTTGYISPAPPPWFCRLRHAFDRRTTDRWQDTSSRIWDLSNEGERRSAFRSASRHCATLTKVSLRKATEQVETDLGASLDSITGQQLMLTAAEIQELHSRGHLIGSHGVEHPNLGQITENLVRDEMSQSKETLTDILDSPIRHFSYPKPILQPHHTPATYQICEASGYTTAVTCETGTCGLGSNLMACPRLLAPLSSQELHWMIENVFCGRTRF
jgi:peptidoglycan/xylan/chitin deacetylase (PgdA/CDA1 family)